MSRDMLASLPCTELNSILFCLQVMRPEYARHKKGLLFIYNKVPSTSASALYTIC